MSFIENLQKIANIKLENTLKNVFDFKYEKYDYNETETNNILSSKEYNDILNKYLKLINNNTKEILKGTNNKIFKKSIPIQYENSFYQFNVNDINKDILGISCDDSYDS